MGYSKAASQWYNKKPINPVDWLLITLAETWANELPQTPIIYGRIVLPVTTFSTQNITMLTMSIAGEFAQERINSKLNLQFC